MTSRIDREPGIVIAVGAERRTRFRMARADELHSLGRGLFVWSAFDSSVRAELWSSAVAHDGGLTVFDPIALASDALIELLEHGPVRAIALTNANHERDAWRWSERYEVPVHARAEAAAGFATATCIDAPPPGWQRRELDGAAPGETAYHHAATGGLTVLGDILINLATHPFQPLPDKYCADPKVVPQSLARLLDLQFERLAFAHGEPILEGAYGRLAALVASLR